MEFIYCQEFWTISAFLRTSKKASDKKSIAVNGEQKSVEIEALIKKKLSSLTKNDIYRKELADDILELAKNVSLTCQWVPYMTNFPYKDENNEREYDILGFFKFDVEYYKDNPKEKESVKPMLIQQLPHIVLNTLKEFGKKDENKGINFDTESPIFIFVTSNKTKPSEVSWTPENIEKYKKVISYWTEVYSGQWPDYSETLYDRRIENNLSNRTSELHFIRRNSGFIYMAKDNYEQFFESYMKTWVLDPTPKIRAVLFALRSINESLDHVFLKSNSDIFMNLETIEGKIKNLRLLRGLIQTNLSTIYNELDYNRRQHYTSVLKHLISEFDLQSIVSRVNEKFTIIYDSMEELYLKKSEENQQKAEKGMNILNLLFGVGVLGDLVTITMIALSLGTNSIEAKVLNGLVAIIITGILIATIGFYINMKLKTRKEKIRKTVDAVIEDGKGNIVLIKRKYPPFIDHYALPGGFIEKGESPEQAVIREVMEETNLNVKIVDKIGLYDDEHRDPRGPVHSTAFKCVVIGDISKMESGDDSKMVELFPIRKVNELELAFDHKEILKDAGVLK